MLSAPRVNTSSAAIYLACLTERRAIADAALRSHPRRDGKRTIETRSGSDVACCAIEAANIERRLEQCASHTDAAPPRGPALLRMAISELSLGEYEEDFINGSSFLWTR